MAQVQQSWFKECVADYGETMARIAGTGFQLARSDFARLRFGVGRPATDQDTADHVLEPFSDEERKLLPERIDRAARAVEVALRRGVAAAMNEYNRDPEATVAP